MNNHGFKYSAAFYMSAILLAGAAFTSACNSAAPPRSINGQADSLLAQNGAPKVPAIDQKAIESASNVQITKLNGGTFKLSDYHGKVLVVDFWATYCPPCRRQVPRLAELSRKYHDKGLEVIGLTSDPESDQKTVIEFLKNADAEYTIGYDNQWLSSAFLKGTEDETGPPIPQLFIFSRDGRVVDHLIGDDPRRGINEVEKVVSDQLALR